MSQDRVLVILPGGYLDWVPSDKVPADVELEPITSSYAEYITEVDLVLKHYDDYPIVDRKILVQAQYIRNRQAGLPHFRALRRSRPFQDGDTIEFVTYTVVSDDPDVQDRYVQMRITGQSHSMAEMLATRTFPGLKTDSIFNEGRCNGNQFERTPGLGDHYKGIAEAAGVSVTGKHYCSGLADFPGDPTAWISDRGDALRVARDKGYRMTGYVNHEPGERAPSPDIEIAPEIVQDEVQDILDANPGASAEAVHETVYNLRAGKVDPNPLCVQESAE